MVSDFALGEIEAMQAEGLNPTPADIVRLNALGLAVERGPDAAAFFSMRRAIRLTPSLLLQEPTIAHAIFFAQCLALPMFAEISQVEYTALRAWTLSLANVPDAPPAPAALRKALDAFVAGPLKPVAFSALVSAVEYLIYGLSHTAAEYPEPENSDTQMPADFSSEIALVSGAFALGLGISLDDAKRLTPSRLAAIVERAANSRAFYSERAQQHFRDKKNKALAEFSRTADAIRARLREGRAYRDQGEGRACRDQKGGANG